jgi:SAM-dependent methyltransferase
MKQWIASEAKAFLQSISTEYVTRLMVRLQVQPEDEVLDIGCGPGTLTLPLAKIAKTVTAVDTSSGMLQTLKKEAENNGLQNITYVNKFWRDAEVGVDIADRYHVVIASNSINLLGAKETSIERKQVDWDLYDAITKMNALGGKNYATMPLLDHKITDIYERLGRQYAGFPDHIVVHNVLFQMGVQVGVDYFVIRDNRVHHTRTLSERVAWILSLDDAQRNQLEAIVKSRVHDVPDRKTQVWSLLQWTA